jgi:hypothetical protein
LCKGIDECPNASGLDSLLEVSAMSVKSSSIAASAFLLTFLLAACQKSEAPASAPAPTVAAPAASAPAPTPASADLEFGVAECDEYVKKYLACVESKVPEAVRGQIRASLDQTRTAWRQAATTPEGKAGLAQACSMANEAAKTAMTAYGCSF